MIKRIRAFLNDCTSLADPIPSPKNTDELQVAAIALMVEAASMDQSFDEAERSEIISLARRRFALSEAEAEDLLELAKARVSNTHQLLPFTRIIKDKFSYQERVDLMEELWRVVYADGRVDDYEANLMRRLAGLIYVSDRDCGAARLRVSKRQHPNSEND